ncbi:MAG: aminotransferase class IV family protein [Spirochaetota bacterium]|nr:MAG: aminotransferase class IV family protein [Spirochaetota bacterium]
MEKKQETVVYINSDLHPGGEFIPDSKAAISIWDLGFTMGYNVYDWLRTFKLKPWQLQKHMTRLNRACKASRMELGMSQKELEQIYVELTARNEHLLSKEECHELSIIIEVTGGEYGPLKIDSGHGRAFPIPEGKGRPTVIVKNLPINMKQVAKDYKAGIHLVTTTTRNEHPLSKDPKMKCYNRLFQYIAIYETSLIDPKALPLLLDIYGNLSEVIVGNIFLVYDGKLMTPTTRNILEGIARSDVLDVAEKLKIPVIERDLQPFHLYNADEAFMTNSVCCIWPVNRYNGVPINNEIPGPITRRLTEGWSEWVGCDITGQNLI